MSTGPESEPGQYVVRSKVRSGFKRDFEFALKSQSQFGSSSVGRTRSKNRSSEIPIALEPRHQQRDVGSISKAPICIDDDADFGGEMATTPFGMEELLSSGVLNGSWVMCRTGFEEDIGLWAIIKEGKIFCYCHSCNGVRAVSADEFEQHAGVLEGDPAECIHFENGKTFHDILEACKGVPLGLLESSVKKVIGPVPPKKSYTCGTCGETFHTSSTKKLTLQCDSCLELSGETSSPSTSNGASNSGRPLKKRSVIKKAICGKLTMKNLRLHKLLFENGDLLKEVSEQPVKYLVSGVTYLQGKLCDTGIYCFCCQQVVSPSQFEAHAGHKQRRKPYHHIYLPSGVSLHELSIRLSEEWKSPSRENDDLCSICKDGGDLLCCDLCPRAFHMGCLRLSMIPSGKWHCQYCQNMQQREMVVKCNKNAFAAGRVPGADPVKQILQRCIRTVKIPEVDIGGCVLCSEQDYSTSEFGPRTVIICDQCQKEHHVGCLKAHNSFNLKELPEAEWFCCNNCRMIYFALQELISKGAEPLPEQDAYLVKRKLAEKGLSNEANANIRWSLLNGKLLDPNKNLLFAEAISIFQESFGCIADNVTGEDLIPAMVKGEKFSDDNDYTGMYCAVLTLSATVHSAGIIRVLGSEIAELPLVATRQDSQGRGYFGALFACIERLLASLSVKHLLLHSAEESESIWTTKFGFSRATQEELDSCSKGIRITAFEGTRMLWKMVPDIQLI